MEENVEMDTIQAKENGVVLYNAKKISEIFGVNINKSTDFLKKFGVKIGHWQIEQGKLLTVLRENAGVLM